MNHQNSKTCRYCSEKIAADAKVCPRCGQWLSILNLRNPAILVLVLCIWMAVGITAFELVLRKHFNHGIDFSPYRNQISITESHMTFDTNSFEHEPVVSVIAIVTNQTDLAWRRVSFEARFFDKAGTLIDVGEGYALGSLYPKSNAAVRIEANALYPIADYDSYKIYVGSAEDARSLF